MACRSSCMPTSFPTSAAPHSPPATARCRPTISNTPTRRASRRWRGRHGRGAAARRLLLHPRDEGAPGRSVPPARRADGGGDRLQSRHLAADLAAAHHEHGGDAVRADRRRVHRRHRRARPRARSASWRPSARWRPASAPTSPSGTSSGRPNWSTGSASTRCMPASGGGNETTSRRPRRCAAGRLARHLSRRHAEARPRLPARHRGQCGGRGAHRGAKGEPVYGINTGFGKLASVRIPADDLETLQRNIVLSHAAGVGEPMPVAVTRLMMALKLASLGAGRLGRPAGDRRPARRRCWPATSSPVVPRPGLGRRLRRPRAAGAHDRRDDRRRRDATRRTAASRPAARRCATRACAADARPEGRPGAAQRHAVLHRLCTGRPVRGRAASTSRRWSPARCRPTPPRAPTRRSIRASTRCAAIAARSRRRMRLRALMAGSAIRESHRVGDERVQDPYCLRCQPQVMGACARPAAPGRGDAGDRGQRRFRQSADLRRTGEALSGGNFHAEPVAFAADMIALAVCEIGSLAERRIAMLVDPALSGMPAFLTPKPGLNSGFMIPQVTAAALVSENKQRAIRRASIPSRPRPTRRTMSRWPRMARAAWRHGRERRRHRRHRTAGGGAGLRLPRAADLQPAALERARALLRAAGADARRRPASSTPTSAAIALDRAGGAISSPPRRRGAAPAGGAARCPSDWLSITRGEAPAARRVDPAHRHRDLAGIWRTRFVSPGWRARTPTGGSTAALRLRRRRWARPSSAPRSRAPSSTSTAIRPALSLYPGQATTGLCPTTTFDGEPLYRPGAGARRRDEIEERRRRATSSPITRRSPARSRGCARPPRVVLYDCHSIRSVTCRALFEGELPVFNIGTNGGATAAPELETIVANICAASGHSRVVNGRFKGGWITRALRPPADGVHAVQMELACRGYMARAARRLARRQLAAPYDPERAGRCALASR